MCAPSTCVFVVCKYIIIITIKITFVSQFSPDVSAKDIEKSLQEQFKLSSVTCTRLKTKCKSYTSFHALVNEEDFPLIIPEYGLTAA
jgi:hypothetical protein